MHVLENGVTMSRKLAGVEVFPVLTPVDPLVGRCHESHALVLRIVDGDRLARRPVNLRLRLAPAGRRLRRPSRYGIEPKVEVTIAPLIFLLAHLSEAAGNLRLEVPIGSRSAPVNAQVLLHIDDVLLFVLCILIRPTIGHAAHPLARSSIHFLFLSFTNLLQLLFVKFGTSSTRR